jgi:hypothetical protein
MNAVARVADPETSHEAAASVENVTVVQDRILHLLDLMGPATDEQIIHQYRVAYGYDATDQSIRSRRAELVRSKHIEFSGIFGLSSSNRRSREWVLA